MNSRLQKCLKCHEEFTTEIDKLDIPYKKICPKCSIRNKKFKGKEGNGTHKKRNMIKGE